jgi:hypothetical protein
MSSSVPNNCVAGALRDIGGAKIRPELNPSRALARDFVLNQGRFQMQIYHKLLTKRLLGYNNKMMPANSPSNARFINVV